MTDHLKSPPKQDGEVHNSTSEREQRLKQIRERAATFKTGTVYAEVYLQDVQFLLSLLDSEAAGAPLTGVIADIEMREGVLDGWHVETVLLTPDERDDLVRDWKALQSQIAQFKQQFELLDDPDGLYSETKSSIESNAAIRMRDLCVEKVRSIAKKFERESFAESGNRRLIEKTRVDTAQAIIEDLESLTLEQEQKTK